MVLTELATLVGPRPGSAMSRLPRRCVEGVPRSANQELLGVCWALGVSKRGLDQGRRDGAKDEQTAARPSAWTS